MENQLIRVVQIPVIEERLRLFKDKIDQRTADAMALVCTEETVQAVKKTRADINREFAELEEQRKAIEAVIMDPLVSFRVTYKECVSDAFKRADADLKGKVADVEGEQKRRCEDGLRAYFDELCVAHHVDFVVYEQAGVVVSLADAKAKTQPPKKLRDQLTQFVERVAKDVASISQMDNAEEVLVEYKGTLDAAAAIGIVADRHRRIEAERAAQEERQAAQAREAEAVKKVEAFAPPVVAPAAPQVARVTFTVTDTVDRLKALKQYLIANGYEYE